jgi:hypothetical protein
VVEYDKTLIAKCSSQNLMLSSTTRIVTLYMTLFMVPNHERIRYRKWTLKAKAITIDDITLPMIASTICKNASTLRMQKLNYSLAKEPGITQCANKCATRMLDTKDKKTDLQSIVKDKCKHLSADPQRNYCSLSLMRHFLTAG